jgi:hypothetical protein
VAVGIADAIALMLALTWGLLVAGTGVGGLP